MKRTVVDRVRSRRPHLFLFAVTLAPGLGCDSTEPLRAVALGLVTQPPATTRSGVELTSAPVVELRDRNGAAFAQPDVSVTVSIADGGGTLVGTTTRTTDASGRVSFPNLTIAGTVGPRTLRFSADGLTAVTSTAIALEAGLPATMLALSPLTVQATVGTAVASLPSVVVKDPSENPVPGVTVTFTFATGAITQTTNASGVATVPEWTMPTTVGQYTVVAMASGVPATTITFTATATPDAPAAMTRTGGDGQSLLYGSRLATPLQVRVTDQYANVTPGVVVTWGSVTGAGAVEPINVATDADGLVRSNYRLGTTPGANVIRASITSRSLSVDFAATALGFTNELAVSAQHTCALDETGIAYCWGQNDYGQVGDGTNTNRLTPTRIGGPLRFRRIAVGWGVTCALTTDNVPYCWGYNPFGVLGDGTKTDRSTPTPVVGGLRFSDITTGNGTATCGLTADGAAYCWGSNQVGQLGIGSSRPPPEKCTDPLNQTMIHPCALAPLPVTGGLTFASIRTSGQHTCALTLEAGAVYCWGYITNYGGNNRPVPDWAPQSAAPGFAFAAVAGDAHTCGIVLPSSAYCWGNVVWGNLGNGLETGLQETPALVPNIAVTHIEAGIGTCAVATDKRAFCWGLNAHGAVGDGTFTNRLVPTGVASSLSFTTISTSGYFTCGRVENGQVHCWGYNAQGQLGVGDTFQRPTPALTRP